MEIDGMDGRCQSCWAVLLAPQCSLPWRAAARNRQAREKYMEHNHGSEYQVKTVRRDGTEELSGWMNNKEQVALAMAAARRLQGKAYWLQERNVLCPNCLDREQRILEYTLTDIPSPRCSPHASRYLRAVGRT